ncbi:QRFP-like peptide receptor [Aplysia californica]|uniref:QRFP-like peptide receptor n=1 Tax=Aplysia californica TaxID=6500 RepID=A0ABM0JKV0_APLCA|nr:QRFP-like peptide receptor [Aplysia californica]
MTNVEELSPFRSESGRSRDVAAYDVLIVEVKDNLSSQTDGPANMTHLAWNVSGNISSGDSYLYDYEAAEYEVPSYEIIPVAIVYGVTLLFGVIGNSLVIFSVTRYQRMRSITNIFLLSLASADLLLVCICIPVKFAAFFTFSWTFGALLCKGVHYLQNVSSLCSVLTLTTMSLERYYAIRHPIRAKSTCTVGRAWRATCILWGVSLVLALPIVFQRIHKLVGERVKAYWCIKDWESTMYSRLYEVYLLLLMLVIPLVIMTFAYVSIIRELWMMASLRSTMTRSGGSSPGHQSIASLSPARNSERSPVIRTSNSDGDEDKTKKQVIKMLVAVILVFVICWAPILISNTLTAFGYLHHLNYGYLKPMRQAFYLMAYANSCINPIIYGFMSRHFRNTFYHALCTCWKLPRHTRSRAMLHRQASWQSRSTNLRDLAELELTSMDVTGCGNCSKSSV